MFLQYAALVCMATVMVLCILLAQHKQTKLFLVVGQYVFSWLAFAVGGFVLTRFLVLFHLINTFQARTTNSIIFIFVVIGILVTVYSHGRTNKW
jgi:hypothetical protein